MLNMRRPTIVVHKVPQYRRDDDDLGRTVSALTVEAPTAGMNMLSSNKAKHRTKLHHLNRVLSVHIDVKAVKQQTHDFVISKAMDVLSRQLLEVP